MDFSQILLIHDTQKQFKHFQIFAPISQDFILL